MRLAFALCVAATQSVATPDARDALAERIEALGSHATTSERNVVEIEECRFRKLLWKTDEKGHETMWSALELELADLAPPEGPHPSIAIAPFPDQSTEIIIFTMLPGTLARQELPKHRNPKPPYTPSSRGDGKTFVFKERGGLLFSYEGIEPGHMAAFADALFDYRRTSHLR